MPRFLAFFSGFPSRRFPQTVADRLRAALPMRRSLVFVSAWPEDHARNDDDSAGMHGMFAACGMPFDRFSVIDARTEACSAQQMIRTADCVFLMGGHPEQQRALLTALQLERPLRETAAAVLGVSAGAINMAVRSLDTKESLIPYEGVGLAEITVKPHFDPTNAELAETIRSVSAVLPVCAMEDNSAIFVEDGRVTHTGRIHWAAEGSIAPFTPEKLNQKTGA